MINSFSDIPAEPAETLKSHYFDKWQGKIDGSDVGDAETFVKSSFIYMQRMFFQARYDKMSTEERLMFHYFATNLLDEAAGYKGMVFGSNENLIADGADHDLYADRLFNRLWELYVNEPSNGLQKKATKTVVSRVLDLFR